MQTAFRILAHTPIWVVILLAYLIWQGMQALRPRTQAVWRMLIVPLVFFGMGLSRLVLARDHASEPLLAWFAARAAARPARCGCPAASPNGARLR